jgi:4-amino-4-deoxy-L-arabinose transferase-like glycosyltransferase
VRSSHLRSSLMPPVTVRVVTAVWMMLLLGASLMWPMGEGNDEITHLDMAYAYAHSPFTFYGPGELVLSQAIEGVHRQTVGIPPKRPLASKEVEARSDRPTLDQLGGNSREPGSAQANQMVQHPPGAYWIYAAVLNAPGVSELSWDKQIWLLRLVGVLLVMPVPALAWGAARLLLAEDRLNPQAAGPLALVAAVLPLSLPNLVRDSASVTNDALLISACSGCLYFLVRVMTGDLRRRVAIGVAICLAVALVTKGLALVLPPVVLAAYALGGVRERRWRDAALGLAISAVGGLAGGTWWLRNLLLYGRVQTVGYGEEFVLEHWGVSGDGDDGRLRDFVGAFGQKFVFRIWGGSGLFDQITPGPAIVYGWFALAATAIAAALVIRGLRGAEHSRLRAWILMAPVVITVGVVAAGSLELWQLKATGPNAAHGRYIYHFVVTTAALISVGCAKVLRPEVLRRLPFAVLLAALITQALTWFALLRTWYGLAGSVRSGLDALLRWSPVPVPVTVGLTAVIPVILGLFALITLVRSSAQASDFRR